MIKDVITSNESKKNNSDKINKLKEIMPNCFDKNGCFYIEKFKKELENDLLYSKESFELNFLGKSYSKMITGLDTETVIVPDTDHNNKIENKNSENIYISGDNLDALKHLLKAYEAKIKCIYIDPPYNTGSDGFVYNDSFAFDKESLITKLDVSEQEAERILSMTSGNSSSYISYNFLVFELLLPPTTTMASTFFDTSSQESCLSLVALHIVLYTIKSSICFLSSSTRA